MKYDIQFESYLFEISSSNRTYQFMNVFESVLCPQDISIEAYQENKHKKWYQRLIDWIKRIIEIHIPAFFKWVYSEKVLPIVKEITNSIAVDIEKSLGELVKEIDGFVNAGHFDNPDISKNGWIENFQKIEEKNMKIYSSKILQTMEKFITTDPNEQITLKSFINLDGSAERRIKMSWTRCKNAFEKYHDKPGMSSFLNELTKAYQIQLKNIRQIIHFGSMSYLNSLSSGMTGELGQQTRNRKFNEDWNKYADIAGERKRGYAF